MRAAATILVLSTVLSGCTVPKPVNLTLGEACQRCRRPIVNERLVAEHIGGNGFAVKFRTIHCMSTWIAQQETVKDEGVFYVAKDDKGGWVRAERAAFVQMIVNPNTMERDFMAFADPAQAAEVARTNNGQVVGWDEVLQLGRTQPLGGN